MKLEWIVYRYDFNKREIVEFNIFNHYRFKEDVNKDLKKCKTREEFAKKLKSNLMYYFWSKYEYEIVISSFPIYIKKEELNRLNEHFKNNTEKYGHEPYSIGVRPDVSSKIDIAEQVMLNFEIFVDYVWSHKKVQ